MVINPRTRALLHVAGLASCL